MRIFLCYSSKNLSQAEAIKLRLVNEGRWVFFDRSSLSPGAEFDSRIRKTISECDLFIFLISPESLADGSYCRTELKFAKERWAHPQSHVLPVMLTRVPLESVPEYLKAVVILEPEGNAPAEVAHAVEMAARTYRRCVVKRFVWIGTLLAVVLGIAAIFLHQKPATVPVAGDPGVPPAPTNAQPLASNIFSRAHTVVAGSNGFFLGLTEPDEIVSLSSDGNSFSPALAIPGEPVALAVDNDSLFVATVHSNAVTQLTANPLKLTEVIPVPQLSLSDGSNDTSFSSIPASLAVITNGLWLITSRDGGDAGLLHRPAGGNWVVPPYLTNSDLAFEFDQMQLSQLGGRIFGVTASTPHYIFEFQPNDFFQYSGHDYLDSIGDFDAICLATNGRIVGLGPDFQYMEVGLSNGKVDVLRKGAGLPGSFTPSSWDYDALADTGNGLLIGLTEVQRGNDYQILQAQVVKLSATGEVTELLQEPDSQVVALAALQNTAVVILRASNHTYKSYIIHLK